MLISCVTYPGKEHSFLKQFNTYTCSTKIVTLQTVTFRSSLWIFPESFSLGQPKHIDVNKLDIDVWRRMCFHNNVLSQISVQPAPLRLQLSCLILKTQIDKLWACQSQVLYSQHVERIILHIWCVKFTIDLALITHPNKHMVTYVKWLHSKDVT